MADFFDRIIDGFFKRIKEERISHAKKKLNSNSEYLDAKHDVANALSNAESTLERLSKKYPEIDFRKDYYKKQGDSSIKEDNENSCDLKSKQNQNNLILFRTLLIISVFIGLYFVFTKSNYLKPSNLATLSFISIGIGVILFIYGVIINIQKTTIKTKVDKRYKSGMKVIGNRSLTHTEQSENQRISKMLIKSAIIFLTFAIIILIVRAFI